MEDMSRKTKRLEKENLTLIRKHDLTNRNILEMAEERTRMNKEMDLLKKKNVNLEKLCRGMQAQGRGVVPTSTKSTAALPVASAGAVGTANAKINTNGYPDTKTTTEATTQADMSHHSTDRTESEYEYDDDDDDDDGDEEEGEGEGEGVDDDDDEDEEDLPELEEVGEEDDEGDVQRSSIQENHGLPMRAGRAGNTNNNNNAMTMKSTLTTEVVSTATTRTATHNSQTASTNGGSRQDLKYGSVPRSSISASPLSTRSSHPITNGVGVGAGAGAGAGSGSKGSVAGVGAGPGGPGGGGSGAKNGRGLKGSTTGAGASAGAGTGMTATRGNAGTR